MRSPKYRLPEATWRIAIINSSGLVPFRQYPSTPTRQAVRTNSGDWLELNSKIGNLGYSNFKRWHSSKSDW